MIPELEKRFSEAEQRYEELGRRLEDPAVYSDVEKSAAIARERAQLEEQVRGWRKYRAMQAALEDAQEMLHDNEMRELAQEEIDELKQQMELLEEHLYKLAVPPDPMDKKNIFLEIRAGTGGEEAALFAAELLRMYTRYAAQKGWQIEIVSMNSTGLGGVKEVIAQVSGKRVYSFLKYESGTHRVQRVPKTEAGGRIHTSAVTVAVMPEVEDVDVEIRPEDIQVDVFRSSGAGGQHVNRTDSAVRITHIPTGFVVTCQDERSQHQNKAKALAVLRSRLYQKEREEQEARMALERKTQVGSGDRSEKVRTYNFPQNRLTDHRVGLTLYKLDQVMDGDLDEVIKALQAHFHRLAVESIKAEGLAETD